MSAACPNGHQSETTDYCDQCGARIEGAGPAPLTVAPASVAPSAPDPALAPPSGAPLTVSDPAAESCPVCHTPRVGQDRFCEGCGYDFTALPPAGATAKPVLAAVPGTTSTPAWEAVAVADRDYFDRVAAEGVIFPLHCPPRTFLLAGDQIRIGRRSNSRGIQPEVDLSGAPEDSAISHLHCILIEEAHGSYSVVDPGSTNGTTLNDDQTPLVANQAAPLTDGDRIHIGAWTTITIRARPPETV